MRLSCNFVNVYTIAYYVYTCTRAHNGHLRDEDVRVGVRVGAVEYQLYTVRVS